SKAQGILPSAKSIGERLDDFGRTIFRPLLSDDKSKSSKDKLPKDAPSSWGGNTKSDLIDIAEGNSGARSGSILNIKSADSRQQRSKRDRNFTQDLDETHRTNNNAYSSGSKAVRVRMERRNNYADQTYNEEGENYGDGSFTPSEPAEQPIVITPKKNAVMAESEAEEDNFSSLPLHKRFLQYHRSAFGNTAISDKKTSSKKAGNSVAGRSLSDSSYVSEKSIVPEESDLSQTSPTASPEAIDSDSSIPEKPIVANKNKRPTPAKRPHLAKRPVPIAVAERVQPTTQNEEYAPNTEKEIVAAHEPAPKIIAEKDFSYIAKASRNPRSSEDGVLFTHKAPILTVQTQGPRKIIVGKESSYEVKIINAGNVAAEDVIVLVDLPEWAEVVGAQADSGTTGVVSQAKTHAPFQWKAGHVEAKSQKKMVLHILPRLSKPFELALRWQCRPLASETKIEVQEPKLEMQLEGPHEVYYGRKETFRLKIRNIGNGNAEGVAIRFDPLGSGDNLPAVYQLGTLEAGNEKIIEVELTARQSGMLEIQVEAKGDACKSVRLSEKVLVHRGGLNIKVEGPKLQFLGSTVMYTIKVQNPGNAPARKVKFIAALPTALKYTGGVDDAHYEAKGNKLLWDVDSIQPGSVQTFRIKGVLGFAGANRLEVAASAEEDLNASGAALTQVESVANLALNVQDPGGPVRVGDEASYKIHVTNRGTKAAEGIEVVGYFARGIEPTSAYGASNRVSPGQVVFSPIAKLLAGSEVILTINARAESSGNHLFRAEVHCKSLGSRLVSEDTTLYYQDAPAIPQNSQAKPYNRAVH
ncbi:MAG: CARDB domain-containing protein, partial [Thermoguttaceae bacterium]